VSEAELLREQAARLGDERDVVASAIVALEDEERGAALALENRQSHLGRVEQEHAKAEAVASDLVMQVSTARTTIASAEAKLAGFDRRRTEMLGRKEKLAAEEEDLGSVLLDHKAREEAWTCAVRNLEIGKVAAATERTQAEEDLKTLRIRIAESERTLDQAKTELGKARSRMHALLEVQAKLEGVGQGVKALLATKDGALLGLVADRVEAPRPLIPALAALLGSRLEDVVVSDLARGIELLDDLARQGAGRATIVPLHPRRVVDAVSPLPVDDSVVGLLLDELRFATEDTALVQALVGNAIVVRDVEAAVRLRASDACGAIVTLDGTRASLGRPRLGRVGRRSRGAHARDEARNARAGPAGRGEMDGVVTQWLEAHQALRADIGRQQAVLDMARTRAHEGELSLVSAERDLKAVCVQIEHLTRRATSVTAELHELADELILAGEEGEAAERDLGEAEARLAEATALVTNATELSASWRAQVDARRADVMEHKVGIAGTRERLVAQKGTLLRLAKSADELEQRARRLEEELVTNATSFGETAALLVQHQERLALALDESRAKAEALAAVRSEFDALRSDLANRESALRELRSHLDACRAELGQARDRAPRARDDAPAPGLFRRREVPRPRARARRRRLSLARPAGRGDARTNRRAHRAHRADGEREPRRRPRARGGGEALRLLFGAEGRPGQGTGRSRTRHPADEPRVEASLRGDVRGGQPEVPGDLPADVPRRAGVAPPHEPGRLLETGIDILAQPPGKKLSNIELMSGGEKALTAVSLIFAIFQIKPSPFCILDEVDAPLDEANVARYNELIRSMTDRSQFILITHIKRTMQLADVLYGVTMQESPGAGTPSQVHPRLDVLYGVTMQESHISWGLAAREREGSDAALRLFRPCRARLRGIRVRRPSVGVVDRVVQPAALLPRERALDDELRDARDVAELEEVPRDEVLPVVLDDLLLQERDAARRARQALGRADDADVVPHEAAELVPVLRDDDRLVGRCPPRPRPSRARRATASSLVASLSASAARWPKTSPSRSEFDARRLAPWSPCARTRRWPRGQGWWSALEVRRDAAALVVRRGDDRDGLRRDVDAERRHSA
jgi:chromosome segregation protein